MISNITSSGAHPLYGITESSYGRPAGNFYHRITTEQSTASPVLNSGSSVDSSEKPKLKDRLVYPFKAIRNRIYTTMSASGSAGVFLGMGVGMGVGATAGFAVGMIPQILQMLVFSFDPYALAGALVGKEIGVRSGAFLGLGIGAVTSLASVAICLALSVVHLPRDIYRNYSAPSKG